MKQKSLFKKLSEGFVRLLALSAVVQMVTGRTQAQDTKSEAFPFQFDDGDDSFESDLISSMYLEFDEIPDDNELINTLFKGFDEISDEQKDLHLDVTTSILRLLNRHRLTMTFDPITLKRTTNNKIPKVGTVVKIVDSMGNRQQISALEIYSYAVHIGELNHELILQEGYQLFNEKTHIENISQYMSAKSIDLIMEGYFLNYAQYLYEEHRATIEKKFSYANMGKAVRNMIQFHEAMREGIDKSQLVEAYELLGNAKLFVEREMKMAFKEVKLPERDQSSFYSSLWTTVYIENALSSTRENIHTQFQELYQKHYPGALSLSEFDALNSEIQVLEDNLITKAEEWTWMLNLKMIPLSINSIIALLYLGYNKFQNNRTIPPAKDEPQTLNNKGKGKGKGKKSNLPQTTASVEDSKDEKDDSAALLAASLAAYKEDYEKKIALEEDRNKTKLIKLAERKLHDDKLTAKYPAICHQLMKVFHAKNIPSKSFDVSSRNKILEAILLSDNMYYADGTKEIDSVRLVQDMLIHLGHQRSSQTFEDLSKAFLKVFENGPDALVIANARTQAEAQAKAAAEAAALAEAQAKANAEAKANSAFDEEMVQEFIKNHSVENSQKRDIPKQKGTVQTSSHPFGSSSSSASPVVCFNRLEDRENAKTLILQLADLVAEYQSNDNKISSDLHELKHDFIKIAAVMEQLINLGCRSLVYSLVNYSNLMVIRNGALHLLEITEEDSVQVEFYRFALIELGTISTLNIVKEDVSKDFNDLLKKIQSKAFQVIQFNLIVSHDIYTLFAADAVQWKGDHEKKSRSDVSEAIHARTALLKFPNLSDKKYTMLYVERAELYLQLKNAGMPIPSDANKMILSKNSFTHTGAAIMRGESSSRSAFHVRQ